MPMNTSSKPPIAAITAHPHALNPSPARGSVFQRRLTHGLARIEDVIEYPGKAPADPPRREILSVRWEQVRADEVPDSLGVPFREPASVPRRLALLSAACTILALLMITLQLGR